MEVPHFGVPHFGGLTWELSGCPTLRGPTLRGHNFGVPHFGCPTLWGPTWGEAPFKVALHLRWRHDSAGGPPFRLGSHILGQLRRVPPFQGGVPLSPPLTLSPPPSSPRRPPAPGVSQPCRTPNASPTSCVSTMASAAGRRAAPPPSCTWAGPPSSCSPWAASMGRWGRGGGARVLRGVMGVLHGVMGGLGGVMGALRGVMGVLEGVIGVLKGALVGRGIMGGVLGGVARVLGGGVNGGPMGSP